MAKHLCLAATTLTAGLALSQTSFANFNPFLIASFSRADANGASGSGHTVAGECGGSFDGSDHAGQRAAKAKLKVTQMGPSTHVSIRLRHARPNTVYTVWVRLKGNDQDGNSFGGSPLTNGGATPLAPSTALDLLESNSPWSNIGSNNAPNTFITDHRGRGRLDVTLDFPLFGGAYPFGSISANALDHIRATINPNATGTPTALVNPNHVGVDGPFLLRIVSHCQDDLGHGLSPAARETWFNYP